MTDGESPCLFPDAFQDTKTLIQTLGHEGMHIMQHTLCKIDGGLTGVMEEAAYGIESSFWMDDLKIGKTGRLEKLR